MTFASSAPALPTVNNPPARLDWLARWTLLPVFHIRPTTPSPARCSFNLFSSYDSLSFLVSVLTVLGHLTILFIIFNQKSSIIDNYSCQHILSQKKGAAVLKKILRTTTFHFFIHPFYITIHPNAFATELARMIRGLKINTYLIMTTKIFFGKATLVKDLFDLSTPITRIPEAGHQGCDRHHDGSRSVVKEIKNCMPMIYKSSDHIPDRTGFPGRSWSLPEPVRLFSSQPSRSSSRYRTLCQGDRTCHCCKQHQHEEQDTDCGSESHVGKYFRNRDKHNADPASLSRT